MSVTKNEAQRLADQRKPIFGWVAGENGWSSAPDDENIYHFKITRAVNAQGGTDFIFTKTAPLKTNRARV